MPSSRRSSTNSEPPSAPIAASDPTSRSGAPGAPPNPPSSPDEYEPVGYRGRRPSRPDTPGRALDGPRSVSGKTDLVWHMTPGAGLRLGDNLPGTPPFSRGRE